MAVEEPVADPVADAAAGTKEEGKAAKDGADEEDEVLHRAQALISLVVEQESEPNPRLIHALATICENQKISYLHECTSDPSINNTNTRGSHTIDKLVNLIRENQDFYELVFSKFLSDTSYHVALRCASARLLLSIEDAFSVSTALSRLKLDEATPPWDLVCKPAPAPTAPSCTPSCPQPDVEVKGADIVEQDWLLLAKNLLHIAIYEISYIRGIFPEDYFRDVPELGMITKMLMPLDVESRRLTDWVEQGVHDALQKKYLETVLFCIHEKDEGPVIDEYEFTLSYPNPSGEEAALKFSLTGNNEKTATFKFDGAESIQNLIRRLIRTCASFTTNLDQIPEERTILMKLMYHDNITPQDYEPPFFECCAKEYNVQVLSKSLGRLFVVSQRAPTLLLDSGATHHICINKKDLSYLRPIKESKRIELEIQGKKVTAKESGWIECGNIKLSQVAYIPKLRFNVVSIGYLDRQGLMVNIYNSHCYIIDVSNSILVGQGKRDRKNNDYVLNLMNWLHHDDDDDDEKEEEEEEEEEQQQRKRDEDKSWVIDSGCADHFAGELSILRHQKKCEQSFTTPKGTLTCTHRGQVQGDVALNDVLYSPNNSTNLLSVARLDSQGCMFTFYGGRCTIVCKETLKVFGVGLLDDGNMLYYINSLVRISGKIKRPRDIDVAVPYCN